MVEKLKATGVILVFFGMLSPQEAREVNTAGSRLDWR